VKRALETRLTGNDFIILLPLLVALVSIVGSWANGQ
jgi:hypothetical protein